MCRKSFACLADVLSVCFDAWYSFELDDYTSQKQVEEGEGWNF